jgi:hypothetical protein
MMNHEGHEDHEDLVFGGASFVKLVVKQND